MDTLLRLEYAKTFGTYLWQRMVEKKRFSCGHPAVWLFYTTRDCVRTYTEGILTI